MPKYSVKKPFTILVAVILVLVLGFVSLTGIQTDLLPAMNLPYLLVMTTYPGASPEQVEADVTQPLENALSVLNGVKNVTSQSNENYSLIFLEYQDDTDMDSAMVKASTAVNQLSDALPDMASTPTLMEISPDMMATQYVAVDYDGMDIYELSDYVSENVLPQLERVDGVASVSTTGLVEKSVQITLDQDKIDAVNDKLLVKVSDRLADAKKELDDNKKKINDGLKELDDAQAQLDAGKSELNTQKADVTTQLRDAITELDKQIPELEKKIANLKTDIDDANRKLEDAKNADTTLPEVTLPIDDALFASCKQILAAWDPQYNANELPANLAECAEPLFRFLREAAEAGKETAERLYHARGWCLHHNSDLWRFTYPATGQARWAYWPVAGLWLCRHICEYYRFTGNLEFLREAYPLLRGSAAFALDLLTGDESGALGTSPSTSPENGFLDPESGRTATVCARGSSMDLELIRECFLNLAEAAAELGLDEPLLAESEPALARLRRPGIGEAGQLLEYDEAYEEAEPHHRHLSHLYGVYPGELFTPDRDPERYEAARISLIRRGDRSTGWAMCWRLALWARFRDGGRADAVLKEFLTPVDPAAETSYQSGGIYPNLLSAHPPFQIDANLGIPAAIAELLVQSHRRSADGTMILDLLPALPPGWEEGKLTGVRARNGVTLDLAWKNSRVAAVRIRAAKPVKVELNAPRFTRRVEAGPEAQFLTSYQ